MKLADIQRDCCVFLGAVLCIYVSNKKMVVNLFSFQLNIKSVSTCFSRPTDADAREKRQTANLEAREIRYFVSKARNQILTNSSIRIPLGLEQVHPVLQLLAYSRQAAAASNVSKAL